MWEDIEMPKDTGRCPQLSEDFRKRLKMSEDTGDIGKHHKTSENVRKMSGDIRKYQNMPANIGSCRQKSGAEVSTAKQYKPPTIG